MTPTIPYRHALSLRSGPGRAGGMVGFPHPGDPMRYLTFLLAAVLVVGLAGCCGTDTQARSDVYSPSVLNRQVSHDGCTFVAGAECAGESLFAFSIETPNILNWLRWAGAPVSTPAAAPYVDPCAPQLSPQADPCGQPAYVAPCTYPPAPPPPPPPAWGSGTDCVSGECLPPGR